MKGDKKHPEEPEDTPAEGGDSGGSALVLRRSEVAVLRRYANRFNFVDAERQEAVDIVMAQLRNRKLSARHKLSAVKVMADLDKVNLAEVGLLIQAKRLKLEELKPAPQTNTQVNVYVDAHVPLTEQGRIAEALAILDAARARAAVEAPKPAADAVRPAKPDAKAG